MNFLITGAGRGIGRGLSISLLERGHRVFLVEKNVEELNNTSKLLSSRFDKQKFRMLECDLRDPVRSRQAAQLASEFFDQHLDCLINNAAFTGGVGGTHLKELTLEEWNASIETNLTAPMLLSQACLPFLEKSTTRTNGGSIIHMSSTRAHQSEPNSEGYATTKAGLIGLMHSMAVSLAPQGIRVNTILPGWINVSEQNKAADEKGSSWEEGLEKADHEWHLTGRVGKVEDIVHAVEYLINAPFVSGTELVVDGGVTRKMVYPE